MDAGKVRENFRRLASEVNEADGYKSVQMARLRDLVGAGQLDAGSIGQIRQSLAEVSLRSTRLTNTETDWALVYDVASAIAPYISAARGEAESTGERLREAAEDLDGSNAGLWIKEHDEFEQLRVIKSRLRLSC